MSGPFGDREAHVGEDRDDLVRHLADRVDAAGLDRRRGGTGRVRSSASRSSWASSAACFRTPRRAASASVDGVLQRVDRGALGLALVGRRACRGWRAGPRSTPSCRARRRARPRAPASSARAGDGGEGFVLQGGEVGHRRARRVGNETAAPRVRTHGGGGGCVWRRAEVTPPWADGPSPARRSRRRPRAR